jgi:hypothetical protein
MSKQILNSRGIQNGATATPDMHQGYLRQAITPPEIDKQNIVVEEEISDLKIRQSEVLCSPLRLNISLTSSYEQHCQIRHRCTPSLHGSGGTCSINCTLR